MQCASVVLRISSPGVEEGEGELSEVEVDGLEGDQFGIFRDCGSEHRDELGEFAGASCGSHGAVIRMVTAAA